MSEITQRQDSRRIFINTLIELAEKDDKIVLIVCDVGFNYIEKFKEKFPKQYWNLGTTEISSLAESAGMALEGMRPYFYSMINFVVFRPYEILRNAICYHNANVKLIGVRGSEKYKFLGFSHNMNGNEDTKVIDHLPNIDYYLPKTNEQVRGTIISSYERNSPAYIRL